MTDFATPGRPEDRAESERWERAKDKTPREPAAATGPEVTEVEVDSPDPTVHNRRMRTAGRTFTERRVRDEIDIPPGARTIRGLRDRNRVIE